MKYSMLIVDDEPNARRYLAEQIEKEKDLLLIGEAKNGKEAIRLCELHGPDMVLLDIEMPGINGIETALKIRSKTSLIIFVTAYDQYAIEAFQAEAFDYLLKPYSRQNLLDTLERAKKQLTITKKAAFSDRIERLYQKFQKEPTEKLKQITIKDSGFEHLINVDDIIGIETSSIYTIIYLQNKHFLYRIALELLDKQLPNNFLRIHRSYLINKDKISKIKYLNDNTFEFTLENNKKWKSSRSYKDKINSTFK